MPTANLNFNSSISGSVSTPANALGAIDGTFTTDTGTTNWTARWRLDAVAGLFSAYGTQTLTLRVRKSSGTGNPTITGVNLYQGGALIKSILGSSFSVTSTTGEDVVCTFDGADINGLETVDIEVVTSGAGGGPSARSSVQIDGATWAATYEDMPSVFKAWNGSSWVPGSLRKWDGARWAAAVVQKWNGTGWVRT